MNIEANEEKITKEILNEFKQKFSLDLPKDYEAFLLKTNGGYLEDFLMTPEFEEEIPGEGIVMQSTNPEQFFSLEEIKEEIEENEDDMVYPSEYLPIAMDSSGNYILLYTQKDYKFGNIYFANHELFDEKTGLYILSKISDSFDLFVNSLYPFEDSSSMEEFEEEFEADDEVDNTNVNTKPSFSNKIVCDSNDLAKKYIEEVKKAYCSLDDGDKFWENFENAYCGATEDDISKLKNMYPEISDTLLDLLKIVDGSYFRAYGENEYSVYLLGSDFQESPYYLLSAKQMLENVNLAYDNLGQYVDRKYDEDEVEMDDKIIEDSSKMKWLHFADYMDQGDTSQLFIDFTPSEKGTKGQIVRTLYDPVEFEIIADSFEEYLLMLLNKDLDFINEYALY